MWTTTTASAARPGTNRHYKDKCQVFYVGRRGGKCGAAGAGAAAGGLGVLKIGLIVLASVAVVSIGAFVAIRISANSAEPQKASAIGDASDREEPEASTIIDQEELEVPEEPDPIDEALEQYRIIISQADCYEYHEYESRFEPVDYRYALVQMQSDDPVPTLLLEMEDEVFSRYARVFQYDPDTKTVHQPTEAIGSDFRGGLSMAGDGDGILACPGPAEPVKPLLGGSHWTEIPSTGTPVGLVRYLRCLI